MRLKHVHEPHYSIDISSMFENTVGNSNTKGQIVINVLGIKTIFKSFQLILPVLVPSWRFFDTIAPSPRIEFALCDDKENITDDWQAFWPRPEIVTPIKMVRRMIWNPCWNENLYVVACAEQLIKVQDAHTQKHSASQIAQRIRQSLPSEKKASCFKFRLIFCKPH